MGDQRISNLVLLKSYPDLIEKMDLIKVLNKFVNKTKCTNRREQLFRKFIPSDLDSAHSIVESETKSANLLSTNSSTLDSLEHFDDTDDDCMESWYVLVLNMSHFLLLFLEW